MADDTFKILISTDNHLGYLEKDPIRGQDSFAAFEEIFKLARKEKVDFVLLGGDLFHDAKPSNTTMMETFRILREYSMGDERIPMIDILSDQCYNFPNPFSVANFLDPKFLVEMPVFTIHGNHDDPSGHALDVLSYAGYVNYFGNYECLQEVEVVPILMQKGSTKLALYGLGNVKDERLHRLFKAGKVKFLRPKENQKDWFNMFVIHQNRNAHSEKNFIPETFLPDFLNLVFWGHEHECRIDPEQCDTNQIHITQPGSSVATSLCEGESVIKHVGILKIKGNQFKLTKNRLKAVRPFVMDSVVLQDQPGLDSKDEKSVRRLVQLKIEELITRAKTEWLELNPGKTEADCPKPLIRLRVDYSNGFQTFSPVRFEQIFIDSVANPRDILLFQSRKQRTTRTNTEITEPSEEIELDTCQVEDFIYQYLQSQKTNVLPERGLTDAIKSFVERDDRDAIKDFVDATQETVKAHLANKPAERLFQQDCLLQDIQEAKEILAQKLAGLGLEDGDVDMEPANKIKGKAKVAEKPEKAKPAPRKKKALVVDSDEEERDEDSEDEPSPPPKKASTSRKRSAATEKAPPAKRGRPKKPVVVDDEAEEEDDDDIQITGVTFSQQATVNPSLPVASTSGTNKRKLPFKK